MSDLYALLGVPANASSAEIERAYRHLIRSHHPDISSDPRAAEITVRLNDARATLLDPAKRERYDLGQGNIFVAPAPGGAGTISRPMTATEMAAARRAARRAGYEDIDRTRGSSSPGPRPTVRDYLIATAFLAAMAAGCIWLGAEFRISSLLLGIFLFFFAENERAPFRSTLYAFKTLLVIALFLALVGGVIWGTFGPDPGS